LKEVVLKEACQLLREKIQYYFTIAVHLKSGLIRAVAIDKRGLLTMQNYFTITVHLRSGLIRGVAFGSREGTL
jgi:hypothetical protein